MEESKDQEQKSLNNKDNNTIIDDDNNNEKYDSKNKFIITKNLNNNEINIRK